MTETTGPGPEDLIRLATPNLPARLDTPHTPPPRFSIPVNLSERQPHVSPPQLATDFSVNHGGLVNAASRFEAFRNLFQRPGARGTSNPARSQARCRTARRPRVAVGGHQLEPKRDIALVTCPTRELRTRFVSIWRRTSTESIACYSPYLVLCVTFNGGFLTALKLLISNQMNG